ncbi:MAG TPA: isopeptide-forming domain-containing fimbrial protein [Chloroflexia bacterium]|nr:isopeptide-forming domain-containing fimbrial protein [Chloroflexia bacterium]
MVKRKHTRSHFYPVQPRAFGLAGRLILCLILLAQLAAPGLLFAGPGSGGTALAAAGDVTKSGTDTTTGSTTVTLPGRTIQWVVGYNNSTGQIQNPATLTDQIKDGQQYVVGSLKLPPSWSGSFSNNGGSSYGYSPVAGSSGTDPTVTTLLATGTNIPSPATGAVGTIGSLSLPASVVAGGGDGWRPIFSADGKRIYVINHHTGGNAWSTTQVGNGSPIINCFDIASNALCSGFPQAIYGGNGYAVSTGFRPEEFVVNNQFFFPGVTRGLVTGGFATAGLACFDMSTNAPCTTPFVPLFNVPSTGDFGRAVDGLIRVNNSAFLVTSNDGVVRCYTFPAYGSCGAYQAFSSSGGIAAYTSNILIGNNLYSTYAVDTTNSNSLTSVRLYLGCTDITTMGGCVNFTSAKSLPLGTTPPAGSWGQKGYIWSYKSPTGGDYAVCVVSHLAALSGGIACYRIDDNSFSAVAPPPNLFASLSIGGGSDIIFTQAKNIGTKLYQPAWTVDSSGTFGASRSLCYDFATQAACSTWNNGTGAPMSWSFGMPNDYEYTQYGKCLYGYGDRGILWSFDPSTGASPCTAEQTATLTATPSQYYCDGKTDAQHSIAWDKVKLIDPVPAGMTSLTANVYNGQTNQLLVSNGNMLPGGLDLSAINYAQNPVLRVDIQGQGQWPSSLNAGLFFKGDKPQMCYKTLVPASYTLKLVTDTATSGGGDSGTATLAIPGISIAKAVDKAQAAPGDTLTYTLTVKNTGGTGSDLTGIQVTDPAPVTGATLVAGSVVLNPATAGAAGTSLPNVATLNLAAGATATVTLKMQLPASGLSNGQTVTNLATATPPTSSGIGAVQASAATQIVFPDLSTSTKGVSGNVGPGSNTRSGDNLTYTVTLKNTAAVAANGVAVSDAIDPSLGVPTNISNGGTYDSTAKKISWSGLSVPAAAGGTAGQLVLTYQVTVKSGLASGTTINNTAVITPPSGSPVSAQAPQLVVVTPDLSQSAKSVSGQAGPGNTARPGNVLTYTVTVQNNGPVAATGVAVSDALDPALGVPASISNGGTYDNPTRTISWSGLSVPAASGTTPGQLVLTYQAQVLLTDTNGTKINNTAIIAPPAEGGPGSSPKAPEITVTTPDLSTSTKTVSGMSGPGNNTKIGDIVTYTVAVKNSGPVDATGVTVTDPVSTYLEGVTAISNGGTFDTTSQKISWNSLAIPAATGASTPGEVDLTFQAKVKSGLASGTIISNQAHVSPPAEGGNGSDPKAPDLTLNGPNLSTSTKGVSGQSGPGNTAKVGDVLTYTVTVVNSGVVSTTGVTVTDPLNDNLEAPTAISNNGQYDANSRTITWTGLTVPAASGTGNGQLPLSFKAKVKATAGQGATISNTATVSPPAEGGPGASPAAPVLTVTEPDLSSSTKGVAGQSGPDQNAKPGDILTYSLVVKNSGTRDATGVVITDTLSTYLANPTGISDGGTYDSASRTISWSGIAVPQNEQKSLTFKAQITVPAGQQPQALSNTAHIAPPVEGGPGADPKAPDLTFGTPNLAPSTKEVATPNGTVNTSGDASAVVRPGDVVTYTVTLANSGSIAASGVNVSDTLDPNLESVSEISNGGQYDAASNAVKWSGLAVPAATATGNGQLQLSFKAKVKATAPDGAIISNTALVNPPAEGGPGATPRAPDLSVDAPNILFKKTVTGVGAGGGNGRQLLPGAEAEYTVRITNPGREKLTNLIFTDGYDYKTGDWPNMQGTTWVGHSTQVSFDPASGTTVKINSEPQDGKAQGNLSIQIGELLPGQTLIVTYRIKLSSNPGDIKNNTIQNQAFTTSDEEKKLSTSSFGGNLPSDDPDTPQLNDPTVSKVLDAVKPPSPSPEASSTIATPGPTPTPGPAPANTGQNGGVNLVADSGAGASNNGAGWLWFGLGLSGLGGGASLMVFALPGKGLLRLRRRFGQRGRGPRF